MAVKTYEYILGEHLQEEQRDENDEIIQPHFFLQTKVILQVDEYPKENKSKINAQLYYYARCDSPEWYNSGGLIGKQISLRFNDNRLYNQKPSISVYNHDGGWSYTDDDKYHYEEGYQAFYLKEGVNEIGYATSLMLDEAQELLHHVGGDKQLTIKARATTRVQGIALFDNEETVADYQEIPVQIVLDRGEYPVVAHSFTDEGTPFITYTAPSTAKSIVRWDRATYMFEYKEVEDTVLSMQLALSFDGVNPDTTYRSLPLYGIEYELELTADERELLREKAQGSTTVPIYYLIKTVRNAKYLTHVNETVSCISATERALTIVGCEPVILPVVRDIDATTVNLTGNSDKFIKNHSLAEYSINATASKGATIVKQSVRCGSKTFIEPSGRIEKVESGTFIFSATDSRNQTVEVVLEKGFVDYVELTCNQKAIIELTQETDATIAMEITGKHFRGSFGAVNNNFIVEVRHSQDGGEPGEWVRVSDFVEVYYEGSSYKMNFDISGLDYNSSYTIQTRAFDKLNSIITAEYTTKIQPMFDWSDKDFNFNVPVTFMGDTMADIVIETGSEAMGTNGTWYWRKWQSGRAECYGCRNFGNMGVSTAWGGLYRSESFSQTLPPGLFVATPEVIDITYRGANFGGWIAKHEAFAADANTSGGFILVRPASATISQAPISFNVIGRWK